MGQNLTLDNFKKHFETIVKDDKNICIELMCHPGNIPETFQWDDFNSSVDRVHEKNEKNFGIFKIT